MASIWVADKEYHADIKVWVADKDYHADLLVFKTDKLAGVIPIFSASSSDEIFLFAIITSKFTIIILASS